jgi:formamidopyrimidine-DNA glycosylase|tara:strand:- start:694 stop:885 length:192 start_codon:yes stop_codon:yes gene_type:complete
MSKNLKTSEIELQAIIEDFFLNKKKKKDNSKNGDVFLNCRSCKTIITNDHRSFKDTRYCADCL